MNLKAWNQAEIARRLKLSPQFISKILRGEIEDENISHKNLRKLNRIDELLGSEKPVEIPPDFDDLSPELREIVQEFYSLTPDQRIEALREIGKAFKYIKPELILDAIEAIKKEKE